MTCQDTEARSGGEGMPVEDRRVWAAPTDLRGLGEVTARWLTGDGVASQPAYEPGCGPDPETHPEMIRVLAAANRAGYVTHASQPGVDYPDGGAGGLGLLQRAGVCGFADDDTLNWLYAAAAGAGLVVVAAEAPEDDDFGNLPSVDVTYVGMSPVTWFGAPYSVFDIRDPEVGYGVCSEAAQDALCRAWQVAVVDPVPGRDDVLWAALAEVFER